jgi:hypothetical protein
MRLLKSFLVVATVLGSSAAARANLGSAFTVQGVLRNQGQL